MENIKTFVPDLNLVRTRRWTAFLQSLKEGSFTIQLDSVRDIYSVISTCSRLNTEREHPYRFSTQADKSNKTLTINVEKC